MLLFTNIWTDSNIPVINLWKLTIWHLLSVTGKHPPFSKQIETYQHEEKPQEVYIIILFLNVGKYLLTFKAFLCKSQGQS